MFEQALNIIHCCAVPGASGGLCAFLLGLRRGHYRNNQYLRKLLIEIIGALATATSLSALWSSTDHQQVAAFCLGIAWASVVQIVRVKITKITEAVLGEALSEKKGGK